MIVKNIVKLSYGRLNSPFNSMASYAKTNPYADNCHLKFHFQDSLINVKPNWERWKNEQCVSNQFIFFTMRITALQDC